MGDRVSFFVIAGATTDEIYAGYKLLTGPTHMLPKAAYGYIQCKQRYASQAELMAVAKGYRERHLPADILVVDWFYYTKMGQMDFDRRFWPDPADMNKQLHDMGFETMISVWPRFVRDDRFYAELLKKGWFIHLAEGTPIDGLPYDRAGSDIDTTNPAAAAWYWKVIRDNILSKGFDSLWADETEPDLPPDGSYFHIGPGTEFFNVYPLFHTAALYNGFRKDEPDRRALILSRDAYTGHSAMGPSSGPPTSIPPGIRSSVRSPPGWTLRPRASRTGPTTPAAGSIFLRCTIRPTRRCSTRRTLAPMWADTTITRSSTRAGSSTPRSCLSSALTAAGWRTRCGRMANRPSRFWKSTCACATS